MFTCTLPASSVQGTRNVKILDPVRSGNHQIPIVAFEGDEDLLKQVSIERPNFIVGDEVKYKDKAYIITRFDDMGNNLKTITVKDNTEYLGGMITGSDVIPYRLESNLERIFKNHNRCYFINKHNIIWS